MFRIKEIDRPNLLNFENKYYISEVSSKKEIQLTLSNKNLYDNIKSQLNFREKIKVIKNISNEIDSGKYNREQMKKFATETSKLNSSVNPFTQNKNTPTQKPIHIGQ